MALNGTALNAAIQKLENRLSSLQSVIVQQDSADAFNEYRGYVQELYGYLRQSRSTNDFREIESMLSEYNQYLDEYSGQDGGGRGGDDMYDQRDQRGYGQQQGGYGQQDQGGGNQYGQQDQRGYDQRDDQEEERYEDDVRVSGPDRRR